MEEDEDLLTDLQDLDKAISISFTVEYKGIGLATFSVPEIQSVPTKKSLVASTPPSSFVNLNVFGPLVHQAQELLNHQLEVLATDEGLQQKLFDLL